MVDIARAFSPVVVLESSEARPKSTDRIRSASLKRLTSAEARRTPPRVSSAVSSIEKVTRAPERYYTGAHRDEKGLEAELKEELKTPLTGINLRELINEKVSKLDRALREVGASSDAGQKKASLISEKLRANAVHNGQSRQQVQTFAGQLAAKVATEDSAPTTIYSDKDEEASAEQDRSTLLEIFKYPGFDEAQITPLPFHVALETEVMRHILSRQYDRAHHAPHVKPLIELYYSAQTKALILDIFWWIFLDTYQSQPDIQKKLLARASNSYISLLMIDIDLRYRDKCFQVYLSLLAESVFACFKVCFPTSIKRMPPDADAAKRTKNENENRAPDITTSANGSGQQAKELINLDKFKSSIANICQLWLGGIPAPPRRYEQWRSKLVQQEKISFVEATPPANSIFESSMTHQFSTHDSPQLKRDSVQQIRFERVKRKEPQERLKALYQTTKDPLPDRRVLFEDYRFDLNGKSPLAEHFLRSGRMLRRAGTQLFISHPQISQVPTVEAETYEKEIKRTAEFCRIVREQKRKERAEEDNYRKMVRKHVAQLKAKDDLKKEQKQTSIYRRKMANFHIDESEIMSVASIQLPD